ncbi:sialate O-acetylesterase [Spirosoma validum]|uniref:PA14 domain-containing protein n=1 Tax=Spirosoma validum TaxID=2771355 RepID=A0A927B7M5_9BACT|nr:sialate O-acetylesterase [Spirosoma validum]MBD2756691.1 hypothetical protein [Spirosoma validum]
MIPFYMRYLPALLLRVGMLLSLFFSSPVVTSAQIQLNFPVSRIVFQRDNANQASVPFRAVLTTNLTHVNVRLVVRQGGATTPWATFSPANGIVSGRVPSVQGGWYDLEVESFNGAQSLGTKRIPRIGVGEVLLVSGQSNAQGFDYETGAVDDRVSCVNYYDGEITESRFPLTFSHLSGQVKVGPTNSLYIYGILGDKLVQRLGVPVLIYGAALGGTPSIQWRQSAERQQLPDADQWGGAEDFRPYRAIKSTIEHYVRRTGLRAILWHHGESDKGKSGSDYASNLQKIIEISRQDIANLPWMIARASWISGGGDNAIVDAQNFVIGQVPNCYPGPNTDLYGNEYRQDGTHFMTSFYAPFAELWNQSLSNTFFQQATPYVLPQEPPSMTAGQPRPAYQYAGGHLEIPFLDEAAASGGSTITYTAQLVSTNGQFVTNLGTGTANPLRITLPDNLTGDFQIKVVSSVGGAVSTVSPPITIFNPPYPKGTGTGLTGQYMSGYDSNLFVMHTQQDGPLDFTWFDTGPTPAMPIRDYTVRWTGQIEAPVSGNYIIKTSYDDATRIWINGQLIVDDLDSHPFPITSRGQITLQANQRYDIRMDVVQRWFNAQARLQWVVPGSTQAVYIPRDRLYPAVVSPTPEAEPLQIRFPVPHMVFQRDNNNRAQMAISGKCPTRTERIEVRVWPTVSGKGQDNDFYTVLDNHPTNGAFSGSISISSGWYKVDIQAIAQGQVISHTRVTPVGVGEVFIVAGEGNAQGVSPMRSVASATDERVSTVPFFNATDTSRIFSLPSFKALAADGTIGPHGVTAWSWEELGERLARRLNLPVLFYNVAWDGTTMRNWRESMEQGTTTLIGGASLPVGMPYSNLKRVLQGYVSVTGLRAILWQQGESEFYSPNPQATTYAADLTALINRSRADAHFSQLQWIVARSSADNTTRQLYASGSYEPVTNRQNEVIQTIAGVTAGPIVDTIQMPRPDGKYFQGTGLSRLAAAWDQVLTNAVWNAGSLSPQAPVFIPDLTPVVYARPTLMYGTTSMNIVLDVVELNGVATTGTVTLKITRDAKVTLSLPSSATSVGGRPVQNSVWNLSTTDPSYYVLTTNQPISAGDRLSVGLTGEMRPGATTGVVTVSSVLLGSQGEQKLTNNADADKVDYFP